MRAAALSPVLMLALAVAVPARAQQPTDGPPGAPTDAPPAPVATLPDIDPASPLDPMPGMEVAWPDMDAPVALDGPLPPPLTEPLPDQQAAAAPPPLEALPPAEEEVAAAGEQAAAFAELGGELGYDVRLDGLGDADGERLRERFDTLSALRASMDEPATAAQINRRAAEDVALLDQLLRIEGWRDALVQPRVESRGDGLRVVLEAEPGPLYRLSEVTLPGIEAAGDDAARLVALHGIAVGEAAADDRIEAGRARLATGARGSGYPFFRARPPVLTVDHAARSGLLEQPVETGERLRFGQVVMRAPERGRAPFSGRHAQRIARYRPGEWYDAAALEDLNRALIDTRLISRVTVEPVPGAAPGTVDIAVTAEPAPPRTIAGELGYGTGEGFRAEASWEHRNLFPPEGALRVRGLAGTQEQLGELTFRRSNLAGRDRVLTVGALGYNRRFDAYDATGGVLSARYERVSTIFFQKLWTWSVGAELVYSDERALFAQASRRAREQFGIVALPAALAFDGSDDLLDPGRGFRLAGRISPEYSLLGGASGYVRAQIDASAYQPVSARIVLAGRVRLGTIAGAGVDDIAPSRRNYAGGGGSVRGYGYQRIGPLYANDDPIGGRGLFELAAEARVRIGAFGGNFALVPFVDAGSVATAVTPDFGDLRVGAGLGLRYHSNFGPIRVDVGTPLNRREGDGIIAVAVSLGQAF